MSYEAIRHFADSYGLAAMVAVYLGFALWTFRPAARHHHHTAARMIFDGRDLRRNPSTEVLAAPTASDRDSSHG